MAKASKKTASKPKEKKLTPDQAAYKSLYSAVGQANDELTQKVNAAKKKFSLSSSGVDFSTLKELEGTQALIKGILASFPDSI